MLGTESKEPSLPERPGVVHPLPSSIHLVVFQSVGLKYMDQRVEAGCPAGQARAGEAHRLLTKSRYSGASHSEVNPFRIIKKLPLLPQYLRKLLLAD